MEIVVRSVELCGEPFKISVACEQARVVRRLQIAGTQNIEWLEIPCCQIVN